MTRKKSVSAKEREAWMALLLSEARMARFVYSNEKESGEDVLLHHNTNVFLRQRLVTEFGLDLDELGVGGDGLYWEARQKPKSWLRSKECRRTLSTRR
jgi:hypothetical protein